MENIATVIKNKIGVGDSSFTPEELSQVESYEYPELEILINKQINEGNSGFYKFIPYLKRVDLVTLASAGHMQTLSDENAIQLLSMIYLADPRPAVLDYIVMESKQKPYALAALKMIASKRPDIIELPKIINEIEIDALDPEEKFEYFRLDYGAIIKVQKEKFLLYRLDPTTHEWVEDPALFASWATGSYNYVPIEIEDKFHIKADPDLDSGRQK